jgi:hypothetical protein
MVWQDIVLSVGSFVFFIALIPTIRIKEKPALSTSIINGIVLAVFAFTYSTLELWLSVCSTSMVFIAWSVLAVQKILKTKK